MTAPDPHAAPPARPLWFFCSDLHGRRESYRALLRRIAADRPRAVLLGGDLLPHVMAGGDRFLDDWLGPALRELRDAMGEAYPAVVAIAGNDDPRALEPAWRDLEQQGLWRYLAGDWCDVDGTPVLGYPWVPPTPFALKDWERYDVSRYIDPGCIAPDEGRHSMDVDRRRLRWETIAGDLDRLTAGRDLSRAVLLCHGPPYGTVLDRAALDGRAVDHAPLDVHVGSVALRRFIERDQPALVLCGHVHEAARLTGAWCQRVGVTWCVNGSAEQPALGLVRFHPGAPDEARRELISPGEACGPRR